MKTCVMVKGVISFLVIDDIGKEKNKKTLTCFIMLESFYYEATSSVCSVWS